MEKLWGVRLAPGVDRRAMTAFLVAALASTGLMTFMNFVQPYVLSEIVKVDPSRQGVVSGDLGMVSELVMIACVGLAGAFSDRIGRRAVYAAGFLVLGLSYLLYPWAGSVSALFGLRAIFAIGAACVTAMLGAVIADYPAPEDRGRATGRMGIMNGLGVIITLFVLAKLPARFSKAGASLVDAGRITYAIVAVLCLLAAILVARGLARGPSITRAVSGESLITRAREGFRAGRDPGIALAYAAAFVSRGDLVVVGTFLTLWVQRAAIEKGLDPAKALAMGGMIAGIAQTAAFLWAPIMGAICDRLSRVSALAVALGLAAVGYAGVGLVRDPTGTAMIVAVTVVGIGEISAVIASQVLVAQQSPPDRRGTISGAFGIFGAFGILLATKLGGHLFDGLAPSAPFVMMGALNAIVFVWAMLVRGRVAPARGEAVVVA
jgi:MFS family permease